MKQRTPSVPLRKIEAHEVVSPQIDATLTEVQPRPGSVLLPVADIGKSDHQPRIEFNEEEIQLLAESISGFKLINPIKVRPKLFRNKEGEFKYELISGERRLLAHKRLKLTEIEAIVVEADDMEAAIEAYTDNEARKNLCDYERGKSFQMILDLDPNLSQGKLAAKVGIAKTTLNRCLSFLKLPADARKILDVHPSVIGGTTVNEFNNPIFENHPEIITKAIQLIVEEKYSEVAAVRWAKAELEKNKIKPEVTPRQVIINGVYYGTLKIESNKVIIACQKDINPESLWEKISSSLK